MIKKKINISLLFNGLRGLELYVYLKKIPFIDINIIFLSKKFLNKNLPIILKKKKIKFHYFEDTNYSKLISMHKKIDLGIIGGFPIIIKLDLINKTKYGFLNCHAGLLPKYRGGSPLNWQIINNEKNFGASIIKVNQKIDGGNIISQKKFKLKKNYNINNLHKIVNKSFPKLIKKSIEKVLQGYNGKKQDIKKFKYYPQRTAQDSKINLKKISSIQLRLMVRALQAPYPNVFFNEGKKKIEISNVSASKKHLLPGEILKTKKIIHFGCKDKAVKSYLKK